MQLDHPAKSHSDLRTSWRLVFWVCYIFLSACSSFHYEAFHSNLIVKISTKVKSIEKWLFSNKDFYFPIVDAVHCGQLGQVG